MSHQCDALKRRLEAVLADLDKLNKSIGQLEDDLALPRSLKTIPLDERIRRIRERIKD